MEEDDQEDALLLLFVLSALQLDVDDSIIHLDSLLVRHIREQHRLNRALPMDKTRTTWSAFSDSLSDNHFRRMFRMTRSMFGKLCYLILMRIGKEAFRCEAFLVEKSSDGSSPYIAGEIKVAISIRMLAGGSYLDLGPLFKVSVSHLYNIFDQFLNWILLTLEFPLVKWLRQRDWAALTKLANEFAEKTNGVFYGPFTSLDGLAVRVRSPRFSEVPDPGNYYCRKGFYALNVQAMCDMKKRFLWCYPSNKGSTHDSAAFTGSKLFELLTELAGELHDRGLFIAGDSAYGLTPFLVTPYDTAQTQTGLVEVRHANDSFNFHLSSCRIYIECAFGEFIMRWGLFWRTLLFDLKKSTRVIQAAMLLQNFIIDNRESAEEDMYYFENFSVNMDRIQQALTEQTGEMPRAVVTDNNEPRRRGRRTIQEEEMRTIGAGVRSRLTVKLATHELKRPMLHDMKYNSYGHIYLDS
jgi:hypothetical protein